MTRLFMLLLVPFLLAADGSINATFMASLFHETSPPSPGHLNEPINMSVVTERFFLSSTLDNPSEGGWKDKTWVPNGSIVSDSGNHDQNDNSVFKCIYPHDKAGGSASCVARYEVSDNNKFTELFVEFWLYISDPWDGHSSGSNKMFIAWKQGESVAPSIVISAQGTNTGNLTPRFNMQNLEVGNGARNLDQNVGAPVVHARDTWMKYTAYFKMNTACDSGGAGAEAQDGIARLWLNDVLVADYTDIGYAGQGSCPYQPYFPINLSLPQTWGGAGDNIANAGNADQYTLVSYFYASAKSEPATGSGSEIPTGGTQLFAEAFDDGDFAGRSWYDGPGTAVDTTTSFAGAASYKCTWDVGASRCTAATKEPKRKLFTASDDVYLRYYMKFSTNWVGSGVNYHPHMIRLFTDMDDSDCTQAGGTNFQGPNNSCLVIDIEIGDASDPYDFGTFRIGINDPKRVDTNCILFKNNTFAGCAGDYDTYVFDENRSSGGCNLLQTLNETTYYDRKDCYQSGSTYPSVIQWLSPTPVITHEFGANYKGDWHKFEVFVAMNSVSGGVGVYDGKLIVEVDDITYVNRQDVLFRTNNNATAKWEQIAILPYIGDGSPVVQSFWIDELVVASDGSTP